MTPHDQLETEITEARAHILSLKDDFDGEGSEGYVTETFDRAVKLLRFLYQHCDHEFSAILTQIPDIMPGPHGSIDIHWHRNHFDLLINVPRDVQSDAAFHLGYQRGIKVNGTIKLEL